MAMLTKFSRLRYKKRPLFFGITLHQCFSSNFSEMHGLTNEVITPRFAFNNIDIYLYYHQDYIQKE